MRYKRAFLAAAIVRADFATLLPTLAKTLPPKIDKVVKHRFPLFEPRAFVKAELAAGPKGIASESRGEGMEWVYHGERRQKTVTIAEDHVDIGYTEYESYADLRSDFLSILDILASTHEGIQISRLGLRYINHIRLPEGEDPLDWAPYVSERLLGILAIADDRTRIARAFQNVTLQMGSMVLKFQSGLHNEDYPARIVKKVFTLDYDAYYGGLLEPQEASTHLDAFHAKIEEQFESHITQRLREMLVVVEDDAA